MPSVLHNLVLGLPKPWEVFAGGPFLFTLMQVLGKVQSSSRKEPHKNQVHLYRSMLLSARRHGKLAGEGTGMFLEDVCPQNGATVYSAISPIPLPSVGHSKLEQVALHLTQKRT